MEVFRFLKKLLLLLPVLLLMLCVNYFVDPSRLIRESSGEYYKNVAGILQSGKNIENFNVGGMYNLRIFTRYLIDGFSSKKEIVVLGSSRTMELGAPDFPGRTFYNNSMGSAGLEDTMAVYWLYRTRKLLPGTVIISLDPWLFNKNSGLRDFEALQTEYNGITEYLCEKKNSSLLNLIDTSMLKKLDVLFSPVYFQLSIQELYGRAFSKRKEMLATSAGISDDWLKRTDGSLGYPLSYKTRTVAQTGDYARQIQQSAIFLQKFSSLDTERFEKFIGLLQKDNVKVIFYLSPYHPVTYKLLLGSDRYRIIGEVQKYFESCAGRHNIEIWGSYDPAFYGLSEKDFYDGSHVRWESMRKIFKKTYYNASGK